MLPDRSKASFVAWPETFPKRCEQISTRSTSICRKTTCVLPKRTIMIDYFHVAQHYRDYVDTLRRTERRLLKKELPKEQAEEFKHIFWPLRKRQDELQGEERSHLANFSAHSPQLQQVYALHEYLTLIFDMAPTHEWAELEVANWRQSVKDTCLSRFEPFLKLLTTWRERILNYFNRCQSSSFVEGFNNKVKVIKQRCYSLTNADHPFQRLPVGLVGYQRFSPWDHLKKVIRCCSLHGKSQRVILCYLPFCV
jgi:transposase